MTTLVVKIYDIIITIRRPVDDMILIFVNC